MSETTSPTPVSGDAMELVERLRRMARVGGHGLEKLVAEVADEIERLHIENIQLKFACGYPMPSELEAHILPSNPFKCGTCEAKSAELERLRSQGGAPEPWDYRDSFAGIVQGGCEECGNCDDDEDGNCACDRIVNSLINAVTLINEDRPQPPVLCRVGVTEGEGNNGSLAKNGAAACMKEALEEILLCPAILDELNGDSETNNAVAKARAALSRATKGGNDDDR